MKKIFFIILSFVVLVSGCTEDQPYCGVEDPAKDLPWLEEKIDEYKGYHSIDVNVYKLTYKGQEGIYVFSDSDEFSDLIQYYYNCEGEEVCKVGGIVGFTCPDLVDSTTYKELLWHN